MFLFCASMLLIYSHISSPRLQYTCSFIFRELLGIDYKLTIDSEKFRLHEGPKINYSDKKISDGEFYLPNHPILFEQSIRVQQINCFTHQEKKAFFKTEEGDFLFDVLAASFYLITRYEEYLDHVKDNYGRFAHENSLAYQEGFLKIPVVNFWVLQFSKALSAKFPGLPIKSPAFRFVPTYDIDIAYSYKHKGLLRNIGGFLKNPSLNRLRVLLGSRNDPFDCYDWLHQLHQQHQLNPIYFFLVAEKTEAFDKNISPQSDSMWKLTQKHAKTYRIGLHPSWQSGDNSSLLIKEKLQLESMCARKITSSRQHYIRFNLPEGYQRLTEAGIKDDYSMGYGTINGFRASVASSFFWYNLEKEKQSDLRIHPFCFMDANSFYEQQQNTQQTQEELTRYIEVCKEAAGTMISIWHNNILGTAKGFEGWRTLYEQFIVRVQR